MCPEVWLEVAEVFCPPLCVVKCKRRTQYPAFAPSSSKVVVEQFGLFVYFVQTLLLLHMQAVNFSPVHFLCVLLLEETFVQVQALQSRVPSPSLSSLPRPFQLQSLRELHREEGLGRWPSVSFTGCPQCGVAPSLPRVPGDLC